MDEVPRGKFKSGRRDYTKEIIRSHALQPERPQSEPEKSHIWQQKRRRGFKKVLLYLLILLLVIGAAGGSWWFIKNRNSSPVPKIIREQLSINLYFPYNLPSGWYVDTNSFRLPSSQVLTFVVKDNQGNNFYVSEQAMPSNFDFAAFQKKFQSPDTFVTAAGDTLVGPVGSNLIASIRTPSGTWLIINTSNLDIQPQLETLCRGFSILKG